MNNLDKQYTALLQDILDNGVKKQTRNGEVFSVFGRTIRHKMSDGFPLLTGKKMFWKGIVSELLWFLQGRTDLRWLLEQGNTIWVGDAIKNYEKHNGEIDWGPFITKEEAFVESMKDDEFAKKWGELGPLYGKQWRRWTKKKMYFSTDGSYENIYEEADQTVIDQISCLINELKTNPDSRRMVVSAWAVHDLPNMVLPPCHYGFQVYTRELSAQERLEWVKANLPNIDVNGFVSNDEYNHKWVESLSNNIPTRAISLMYNARSQDVPLGTPFNIASYALLLEIIAKMVNMVPDELISNMGDCHIYLNQIDGVKEQLTRTAFDLPKLVHMKTDDFYKSLSEDLSLLTHLEPSDFQIEGYKSHPAIKMPLSN